MKNINHLTKNISDILNHFLVPFDLKAQLGTDFSYHFLENRINYALIITDKSNESFNKYVKEKYPYINADIFLWSFLHEIGHSETEDIFEQEDWDYHLKVIQSKPSDEEYYNLPIEAAATAWAAHYMETHKDKVLALWNKLAPAIKNFYKKVGVLNEA